jgi:hypothetical protein
MATKLPGEYIQLKLPPKTKEMLDHISDELGVKTTQLINILIYANENFSCKSFLDSDPETETKEEKTRVDLRMGPYAQKIAVAAARKNNTYTGCWIRNLLIEKVKEWTNGRNIFTGGKLSKNQLLP